MNHLGVFARLVAALVFKAAPFRLRLLALANDLPENRSTYVDPLSVDFVVETVKNWPLSA